MFRATIKQIEGVIIKGVCWLIRLYQLTWSVFLPPCCRFYPSCSHFMVEAVQRRGLFFGGWLGLKRICRCHPWHHGGYDPVDKIN